MVDSRLNNQPSLSLQHFLDLFIRSLSLMISSIYFGPVKSKSHLDMLSNKVMYLLCKTASIVDGTRRHLVGTKNAVCDSHSVIVLTKSRCLVNDAGTVFCGDIGIIDYTEGSVLIL